MSAMLFAASALFAQNSGWPPADQQSQQTSPAADPDQGAVQADQTQNQPQYNNQAPPPQGNGGPQFGQRPPYGQNPNPYAQQAPPPPVPAQLTIAPGTYVTVRINQKLSSDHNRPGDAFTATLVEPLVVNGVVVAEPGETVGGVVSNVEKSSTSKLLVQLTDLTLVDGQRLPLQTQLVARRGPGFTGSDAGTIVGTTAIGAGIGAAADWGTGAAVGGIAGLAIGALITHNHPSVLYPEQILTFQVRSAQTITTENSPQAFRYVQPGEYDRAPASNGPSLEAGSPPPAYYYGYSFGYPYYPYYWGPSFGFGYFGGGGRYWRGGGYRPYGRGFRR